MPGVAHCAEGCRYAHGAPPAPFPPPCVPGSWGCPGDDPAFDTTKVRLAGNFGDGMVLQRGPGRRAAVYGTATPGATVAVTLANTGLGYRWVSAPAPVAAGGGAEHAGAWKVLLPPRPAGEGYTVSAACTGCTDAAAPAATLSAVLYGEVWVCSGQSNMEAMVDVTLARNASYSAADAGAYPNIRLWQTPWRPRKTPTYVLPPLGAGGRPEAIGLCERAVHPQTAG